MAVRRPGSLLSSSFAPWYCAACFTMEQAETRAADFLGVALVDAVEALEDAALVGIRDADAGIHDGERDGLAILPDGNGDAAAGNVILDRVVAEVIDHLLQQLLNTFDHDVLAGQSQRDILFLRDWPQALDHLAGQRVQVDRRFGEVRRAFGPAATAG